MLELSKPMPTKESEPRYPKLSPDQRKEVLEDLKVHLSVNELQKEKPASPKVQ
jgi:hypothetical protein